MRLDFPQPLDHDVRVAKVAQGAEKLSRTVAQLLPIRMRIDLPDGQRDRAASAQGHSKVVNRLGARLPLYGAKLLQGAFHPVRKIAVLSGRA